MARRTAIARRSAAVPPPAGSARPAALRGARAEYQGEFISTHSKQRWLLLARYSDVDLFRFYGFGNETLDTGTDRRGLKTSATRSHSAVSFT